MKKSYLMIAAAAALFAACSDSEKLTNQISQPTQNDKIGFSVYSEKTTRADETNTTNLYAFYKTFDVYSWKTVGTEDPSPVFAHTPVHYFDTDEADGTVYVSPAVPSDEWGEYGEGKIWQTGWFYKDVRYWDKLASEYTFFAIAPYQATYSPAIDVKNEYDNIKIGTENDRYDINTEEKNHMTDIKKYYGFSKDYMLADKMDTKFQKVQLNFHHILTKFNVQITLQPEFVGGNQDLTITDFKVVGLENKGYFVYNTDMATKGWTTQDGQTQTLEFPTDYAIYSIDQNTDTYSGYYWFQTLVFPQTLTCMAEGAQTEAPTGKYLYIEYTIGNETFKAYYDLAYVFNNTLKCVKAAVMYTDEEMAADPTLTQPKEPAVTVAGTYDLAQGSEYTLNILVGPQPIKFEATATGWDEKTTVNHTIQ